MGSLARSSKRNMKPLKVRTSADPKPSADVICRPFSFKENLTGLPVATTLSANYDVVFPDLAASSIIGARIDKITVWGKESALAESGDTPNLEVVLEVGKYFSQRDAPAKDNRACVSCVPWNRAGEDSEETPVRFSGARVIHVVGVVYTRRVPFPSVALTTIAPALASTTLASTGDALTVVSTASSQGSIPTVSVAATPGAPSVHPNTICHCASEPLVSEST